MRVRLAVLAAVCSLGPLAARAQAPTIPPLPAPSAPAGFFAGTPDQYSFSGCATGPVAYTPGGGYETGTSYCVHGLAQFGMWASAAGERGEAAWLDLGVSADPRLGAVYAEANDLQFFGGISTSFVCPVGCTAIYALDRPRGAPGAQSWGAQFGGTGRFVPQGVQLTLGYADPQQPNAFLRTQLVLPVSVVPEPTTFALAAAGGLVMAGVAVRRRRAARRHS